MVKKKAPQNRLKLVRVLCECCGETIDVPKDSICSHCGQKMVKDEKWRHKKYE